MPAKHKILSNIQPFRFQMIYSYFFLDDIVIAWDRFTVPALKHILSTIPRNLIYSFFQFRHPRIQHNSISVDQVTVLQAYSVYFRIFYTFIDRICLKRLSIEKCLSLPNTYFQNRLYRSFYMNITTMVCNRHSINHLLGILNG
jgi:hypothetical protein